MFPRRYYPERYFTPEYFPQSEGTAAETGGGVSATASLVFRVSATTSVEQAVSSTARLNPT